ncbi:DNA-binding protein [Candidatus Woesearchaeota archaeon]|nr:DNA-binding protein [Candidatus Woesearchaeota archaeon]
MNIKDLKSNQGNIDITAEIVSKEEPRAFEKFGKKGKVCNALLKDQTGQIKLTLWNDDGDLIKVGDTIRLQNGWCSEYKGEKQLSTGKFGKIEIVQKEVLSNDPGLFAPPPIDFEAAGEGEEPEFTEEDVE